MEKRKIMNDLIRVTDAEKGEGLLDTNMALNLIDIGEKKKALDELEKKFKEMIKQEMEDNNIKKIVDEISGVTINYIEENTQKENFDKDKLREEYPELYDKYISFGKIKAHIKVTRK